MKPEEVYNYIKEKGFRTNLEISTEFKKEDTEILEAHIKFLTDKNKVRKSKAASATSSIDLYWTPDLG